MRTMALPVSRSSQPPASDFPRSHTSHEPPAPRSAPPVSCAPGRDLSQVPLRRRRSDQRADAAAAAGASAGGAAAAPAAIPTPVALRNGPAHTPIDTPDAAGMSIAIAVTSSTGVDADMARIQDSEVVSVSENHTGSFVGWPAGRSNNSGFMAGHPIPNDQHSFPKALIIDRADNHGGAGTHERRQLDVYTDAAAGVTTATPIPNSGYIIKRTITMVGTGITFRTEKRPAGVTVDGHTTTAGPSPTQGEDVVVRAPAPAAAPAPSMSAGKKAAIGALGGAAVGAGIGAFAGGPVGAAIGAGVGGLAGGLGSLLF